MKKQHLAHQRQRLCEAVTAYVAGCQGRILEERRDTAAGLIGCSMRTVQHAMETPGERESWSKFIGRDSWMMNSRNLADFAAVAEVSLNFILLGALPTKLDGVRVGSWTDDFSDWLRAEFDMRNDAPLDVQRVQQFVRDALRAAQTQDSRVFEKEQPVLDMAAELLLKRSNGDREQRERWSLWNARAGERMDAAHYLGIFDPPRYTCDDGAGGIGTPRPLSNVDLRPIPEFEIRIVSQPQTQPTKRAAKRRKA